MRIKMNIFENINIDEINLIKNVLNESGYEVYIVGGAIRNLIHNKIHSDKITFEFDFDLATNAKPEDIIRLFNFHINNIKVFTVPTGIQHGTVSVFVVNNGITKQFEITTFRTENTYSDSRHPDEVEFLNNIEQDLYRRDFTINALAYDISNYEIIDLFNGIKDIENRIIRSVGNSLDRFNEDALRPLRACRFASQLNYKIDEEIINTIPLVLDKINKISKERIRDEFIKLMKSKKPSIGIEYLRKTGILNLFIPELLEGFGVMQNEFHKYDIYYHNIYSCDYADTNDPILKIAILFHDIGKPRAKKIANETGNGNVFYNHEIIGEKMADKILKRLKFSNQDIKRITLLIRMHMFYYTENWTDSAIRRFLRKIDGSIEVLKDLFILRKADRLGSGTKDGDSDILDKFEKRILKIKEEDNALKVTDLDIDGYDIMNHFHLKPSRIIGEMLEYMLEKVLDNPDFNKKEILLKIGEEFLSNYNLNK